MTDVLVDARAALLSAYRAGTTQSLAAGLAVAGTAVAEVGIGYVYLHEYIVWWVPIIGFTLWLTFDFFLRALFWSGFSRVAFSERLSARANQALLSEEQWRELSGQKSVDAIQVMHDMFARRLLVDAEGNDQRIPWAFFVSVRGVSMVSLGVVFVVSACVDYSLESSWSTSSFVWLLLVVGLAFVLAGLVVRRGDAHNTRRAFNAPLMEPEENP